jgi:hypothetical protein
MKDVNLAQELAIDLLKNKEFFLDSGAYSAFTLKKNINIDDYIAFIKKYEKQISLYATLDVIGDYKKTTVNTEYMESKGLKPLPTFHYGSPKSELKRMLEKYDYIALGGLVPLAKKRKKLQQWLDGCFSVIGKYWPKKIHGFGVNAVWAWKRYPFYSVDATSWLKFAIHRTILQFENHEITLVNIRDHSKKGAELLSLIKNRKDYNFMYAQNIKAYREAAEYVTKLWKCKGINWDKK